MPLVKRKPRKWLKPAQVADMLGLAVTTLNGGGAGTHTLKRIYLGEGDRQVIRYLEAEVLEFMDRHEAEAAVRAEKMGAGSEKAA